MSLPSRERGLKSVIVNVDPDIGLVAPFAGAWIEIPKEQEQYPKYKCRSLRGSVD